MYLKAAKDANGELQLFTCPTAVSEEKTDAGDFCMTVPHNILTVALNTTYTFVYERETVSVEHSEMIRFLVWEV